METNPRPTKVLIVKLMDKVMHGRANGVERSKDTHRRALFNSIFMTSKIERSLGTTYSQKAASHIQVYWYHDI
jgi:hypothetical protein